MPTSPTPITALPTVPQRSDPTNFAARGDTFLAALPTFRTETNAVATNVYNNAVEADADAVSASVSASAAAGSASSASSSASSASASATAAAQSAGAPVWVSGTTYAIGNVVYSPLSLSIYRRKTNGAGTTDPSLDSTNWDVAGPPAPQLFLITSASQTAANNAHYVLTGAVQQTITAPASPVVGDVFTVTVANGRTDTVIARNSQNIQGLAEDMTLDSANASVTLRFAGTTPGWRMV